MQEKNLEYLKETLKYMGFGTNMHAELEQQMQQALPSFQLHLQSTQPRGLVDYDLHFRKPDGADRYFFNKYDATLHDQETAQSRSQTFYLHKNSGITAKEAYNLLDGRAVHKELMNAENQPYKAWLQLDPTQQDAHGNFKVRQFHENYGFDLEKTLDRFYIKELQDPQAREQLLYSLQKGNRQPVTALEEGYEVKRLVEASPQFKTINVYNELGQQAMRETIQKQDNSLGVARHPRQQPAQETPAQEKRLEQRPAHRKGLGL